jgi:PAS domain S-box-containing protein
MAGGDDRQRTGILSELREIRERISDLERSERALSQEAHSAAEARARAIIENAYDLISELDAAGVFVWASPNVEATLGFRPEELMGLFVLDHVHPDDLERTTAALATVLERGRVREQEYRYRHKNGSWVWLETTSSIYTDQCGRMRILAVSRDVTERRRHLEEREEAIREKEQALAQVKVLSGLLPICTHCRKVRDDAGYWRSLEAYVSDHSSCIFSHSLCEKCLKQHYGHILGDDPEIS